MLIEVENIKCGGCANGINQKLLAMEGIDDVSVDVQSGQVSVMAASDSPELKQAVLQQLTSMGYPEKGSVEGLRSVKAKAASYVSCAIGKMTDDK